MNALHLSLWQRGLLLMWAGLLTLAPFLHGHVGASYDTGFHLDGLHAVQASAPVGMSALPVSDEESPALGVGVSLPLPDAGVLALLGLALCMALWRLFPPCAGRLPCVPRPRVLGRALYRAGLPPPCQAPPGA